MAQDTTWCQNPRCPERKISTQIRGTKGKKYYQSSKASGYGNGNFCTLNCFYQWADKYMDRAIDNLGIRIMEPVKLPMESAWRKDMKWNYADDGDSYYTHFIENKLMNIKIPITEQQYDSIGYGNDECLTLANQIGYKQSA
tara:strand:- start:461 stop:883 length:423 start_codon:yes stop_codon:yes gene_type:complete